MAIAYKNEINTAGLMKSPTPIDGSDDIILFIPYSLIATDGAATAQDARIVEYKASDLSPPFLPYADITDAVYDEWIAAFEALNVVDEETGETGLDVMKASLAEQCTAILNPVMVPVAPNE
jgi:hypothetical protein